MKLKIVLEASDKADYGLHFSEGGSTEVVKDTRLFVDTVKELLDIKEPES